MNPKASRTLLVLLLLPTLVSAQPHRSSMESPPPELRDVAAWRRLLLEKPRTTHDELAAFIDAQPCSRRPLVHELVRSLRSSDSESVSAAASALNRLGPVAREAIPDALTTLEALADRSPWSTRDLLGFLDAQVLVDTDLVVPRLVGLLGRTDASEVSELLVTLGRPSLLPLLAAIEGVSLPPERSAPIGRSLEELLAAQPRLLPEVFTWLAASRSTKAINQTLRILLDAALSNADLAEPLIAWRRSRVGRSRVDGASAELRAAFDQLAERPREAKPSRSADVAPPLSPHDVEDLATLFEHAVLDRNYSIPCSGRPVVPGGARLIQAGSEGWDALLTLTHHASADVRRLALTTLQSAPVYGPLVTRAEQAFLDGDRTVRNAAREILIHRAGESSLGRTLAEPLVEGGHPSSINPHDLRLFLAFAEATDRPFLQQLGFDTTASETLRRLAFTKVIDLMAKDAAPELNQLLDDNTLPEYLEEAAMVRLSALAPDSPWLRATLRRNFVANEGSLHNVAANLLRNEDRLDAEFLRVLIASREGKAPTFDVVRLLVHRQIHDERAVVLLVDALSDEQLQGEALTALRALGATARGAVGPLLQLLTEDSDNDEVLATLSSIAPEVAATRLGLLLTTEPARAVEILSEEHVRVDLSLLPQLIRLVSNGEGAEPSADQVAVLIEELGPPAREALPALEEATLDGRLELSIAVSAMRALLAKSEPPTDVLLRLRRRAEDREEEDLLWRLTDEE